MSIKEIAWDLTIFTLSNVNDAISFKPQLCFEVPKQDYQQLKENYINFTGTSIRKNRSKLFFLPTNVSDELQKLNASVPESAKNVPNDGRIYYKNRLITELDYENVKRVETACAFIAYTALNSFVHFETDIRSGSGADASEVVELEAGSSSGGVGHSNGNNNSNNNNEDDEEPTEEVSSGESVSRALRKGNILGFRELGHLVGITPWHFHRVFKVITGLTIREYGQLCVEFIKKNKELINACRARVENSKSRERYSCLEDAEFLGEAGGLQYPATENVVLLHEYFIDPNKSKEFKKRKSSAAKPVQDEVNYGVTQRSQIRKRRSSVMYGRMHRASQNSITSNSLHDCLTSPTQAAARVPFHAHSDDEHEHEHDNDTDESTSASASSDWDTPAHNILAPMTAATRPTSPAINYNSGTSRKNSVISIGSANANKVSKKGGILLDGHRRNRSEGLGLNLELLRDASLDHKLSVANTPAIEFNNNMFNDGDEMDFANFDYSSLSNMFQRQYKLDQRGTGNPGAGTAAAAAAAAAAASSAFPGADMNVNVNVNPNFSAGTHPHNPYANAHAHAHASASAGPNANGLPNGIPSMTDISLFNNSLMDQTTPAASLLLDTDPTTASTDVHEELNVDTLLNNSTSLLDELLPFNAQPQRKESELFNMPEESDLFDPLSGDLLAGDALLSFEH